MQAPTNERQEKRLEVLDWKKEESCPSRRNSTRSSMAGRRSERMAASRCSSRAASIPSRSAAPRAPTERRRVGQVGLGKRLRQVQFETVVEDLGPKGSYAIIEQPGFVHYPIRARRLQGDKTRTVFPFSTRT